MSNKKKEFIDQFTEEVEELQKAIKLERHTQKIYEEEISDVIVDFILDEVLELIPKIRSYDEGEVIVTQTLNKIFPALSKEINYNILEKVVMKLCKIFKNTPVTFWYRNVNDDGVLWSTNIIVTKKDNKYSNYYGDNQDMLLAELPLKVISNDDYVYMYELLCFGNAYKYFKDYYYDIKQMREYSDKKNKLKTKKEIVQKDNN